MRFLYIALLINLGLFAQTPTQIIDNNESINFTYINKALDNQWISSIFEDEQGFMWFGTQNGLYKYDGYRFYSYKYNPLSPNSLPANWVRQVSQDKDGIFWLSTYGEGLVRFDQEKKTFKSIFSKGPEGMMSKLALSNFVTSKNAVWSVADDGIFRKSENDSVFKRIGTRGRTVFIAETTNEKEILAINDTIYGYNPINKSLEVLHKNLPVSRLAVNSKNELVFNHNGIVFTKKDNQEQIPIEIPEYISLISNIQDDKCVFIGNNHFYKYDFKTNKAKVLSYNTAKIEIADINTLYLDQNDIIWVGTNKGVFRENKVGNVFLNTIDLHARRMLNANNGLFIGGKDGLFYYSKATKSHEALIENTSIVSLLKTKEGIWAGDMSGRLFFINHNHKLTAYDLQDDNNGGLLFGLVEDANGFIWVNTWHEVYLVDKNAKIIEKFKFDKYQDTKDLKAVKLHLDRKGDLWVVTVGNGLYRIPKIADISSKKTPFDYKHYYHIKGDRNSLNSNATTDLHEDNDGDIWVGSDFGINRYVPEKDAFEILKINNAYFDKKVMAMEADSNNLLWISTISNGLYVFNKDNENLLNLRETDGLLSNACLYTSSNYNGKELYFGTDRGIQIINPSLIVTPNINKEPLITNLSVLGEEPLSINAATLNGKTIELTHKQTDISIDFSLNDYRFPEKINYYYKLENSHTDWRKAYNNRVSYTNLRPGNYNFLLKASYQSEKEAPFANLVINVSKPWYKTIVAYIFYILALASLVILYVQLKIKQKTASDRLKVVRDLDRMKTNLFTNISHELRTPLTLILGPIDKQLERHDLLEKDKKELSLVKQNTNRLLNLVNQMTDLSLIDSGQLRLKVAKGNLGVLLQQIVEAFQYKAEDNNLKIEANIAQIEDAYFDKDIVEKVTSNLLSNAIKYSTNGSSIYVQAGEQNKSLVLFIVNTYEKVGRKDLSKLFRRFYQDDEAAEGIGVGLALVKELVTLGKGTIIANNIAENQIQFNVTLPIHSDAFEDFEFVQTKKNTFESIPEVDEHINSKSKVLVVEDHNDILEFVVSVFKDDYQVIKAKNGQIGVEKTKKHLPDIIISDVMMPVKDGIALCNEVKHNDYTSHIPVILLTAKTGESNEIEGLKTGADAYITKPFSSQLLKTRVEQLLSSRKKLKTLYAKEFTIVPELAITSTETDFLNRLKAVLETHLTDPLFKSEHLGKYLYLSRTQLHRKLKAIYGLSTSEFIRSQRIKLATRLLKESDATVSEIAYQVGFNTPSYFIKCFKDTYQCTPNAYISKT